MSKNYIFRKFECGLTKEETAKLCFKTVRTVTGWDNGRDIPPECRRLMRWAKNRELSASEKWHGFKIKSGLMELPTGKSISPQELLIGIALLEIQDCNSIKVLSKILKYSRIINEIKK